LKSTAARMFPMIKRKAFRRHARNKSHSKIHSVYLVRFRRRGILNGFKTYHRLLEVAASQKAAKALQCDESEDRFEEALRAVAKQQPRPQQPKKPAK
jgi:hypothetical protein